MGGNVLGTLFRVVSFGESHGPALGVVIDGLPPRLFVSPEKLQQDLDRRAPGNVPGTSQRKEPDRAHILSGVFEGQSLGTPVAVVVWNEDQRPRDYDDFRHQERPGHGDRTYRLKYGIRDHRGGGRASGRETLARVIAGYFAGLLLPDTRVWFYTKSLGPFEFKGIPNPEQVAPPYFFPDPKEQAPIESYLLGLQEKGESCGGRMGLVIDGCPPGLGEPVFNKLKADLAQAFLSLGGCVSCSFGLGEEMARAVGSFVQEKSANFGGIEGGISNGERISLELVFKPPSTLGKMARQGRHDPCLLPRAAVVAEAMAKCVLADHSLRQRAVA